MEFTIYETADDFLQDNKKLLDEHSVEANLIIANAQSKKSKADGFFGAAIKNESGVYVATQIKPFPMVHFSVGENTNDMAAFFVEKLSEIGELPEKISGVKETIDSFKEYANKLGAGYQESRYLFLRICYKVNDIDIADGQFQSPVTSDFDFGPWYVGINKDCQLDEPIDRASEMMKEIAESGRLVCFTVNGVPVTMAAKSRNVLGGRFVALVYTPDELRGKGYSTACVKHLTQELLDEGNKAAALYADKYNPISNHIYEKLGYKKIGEFMEYRRTAL